MNCLGPIKLFFKRDIDSWSVGTVILCCLLLAPLMMVVAGMGKTGVEWPHIQSTVLAEYLVNTLILVVCVSGLSMLFAIPTAWLVSYYEFKGRRFWQWALVLPLAIPSYVAAFTYYDLLDAVIPLLVYIRQTWGLDASQWVERGIRYGLLIFILSSVLYPYLFLSLRTTFSRQQSIFFEASRMLGRSSLAMFWRVGLPLSRPALAAALSLIIMEVVNDYGAVHFFGVPTLTEGIFRTWFGLGDRVSGLRIAGLMMLFIFLILGLERWQRRRRRFTAGNLSGKTVNRVVLSTRPTLLVYMICGIPLVLGFIFPVGRLLHWLYLSYESLAMRQLFGQGARSLLLALSVTVLLCGIALLFSFCSKLHTGRWFHRLIRGATLGYAMPGAVIAVGMMILLGHIDRLHGWQWLLSGSLFAISFAYLVRFLTVSFQPVQAGMQQVCGSLHDASRMMGQSNRRTLFKIHWPLLKTTILASGILVFIDITKELPLTLILRPAAFETLATFAFGFAKEGNIYDCALPCLMIVLLGAAGLFYVNRWLDNTLNP